MLVKDDKLFSQEMLDRDTLKPPKGAGAEVRAHVRCFVRDEQKGLEYNVDKTMLIDILDQDDNPPVLQTKSSVKIKLKEFTVV